MILDEHILVEEAVIPAAPILHREVVPLQRAIRRQGAAVLHAALTVQVGVRRAEVLRQVGLDAGIRVQ